MEEANEFLTKCDVEVRLDKVSRTSTVTRPAVFLSRPRRKNCNPSETKITKGWSDPRDGSLTCQFGAGAVPTGCVENLEAFASRIITTPPRAGHSETVWGLYGERSAFLQG